jgi:hypothetical protein
MFAVKHQMYDKSRNVVTKNMLHELCLEFNVGVNTVCRKTTHTEVRLLASRVSKRTLLPGAFIPDRRAA